MAACSNPRISKSKRAGASDLRPSGRRKNYYNAVVSVSLHVLVDQGFSSALPLKREHSHLLAVRFT